MLEQAHVRTRGRGEDNTHHGAHDPTSSAETPEFVHTVHTLHSTLLMLDDVHGRRLGQHKPNKVRHAASCYAGTLESPSGVAA